MTEEHQNVRDRYGRGPLGQNLLLARRLIEAGVRLVTVNAWCGLAPGYDFLNHTQSWDHHGAAVQKCGIFSNGTFGLGFALPQFDAAVSALLEELDERGLLSTTLVYRDASQCRFGIDASKRGTLLGRATSTINRSLRHQRIQCNICGILRR